MKEFLEQKKSGDRKMWKRILSITLAMLMFVLAVCPTQSVKAAKKGEAQTIIVTLNEENPDVHYRYTLSKKSKIDVKCKIISVTGKPKAKKVEYWIGCDTDMLKGSLFYYLKRNQFKKGKVLKSHELMDNRHQNGRLDFWRPDGVTEIQIKITLTPQKKGASFSQFEEYNPRMLDY